MSRKGRGQTAEGSQMAPGSRHQAPTGSSRQHAAGSMQQAAGRRRRRQATCSRQAGVGGRRTECVLRSTAGSAQISNTVSSGPTPASASATWETLNSSQRWFPARAKAGTRCWTRVGRGSAGGCLRRGEPKHALITALLLHALAATKSRRAADCIYRYCSSPAFLVAVAFLSKGLFTVYF